MIKNFLNGNKLEKETGFSIGQFLKNSIKYVNIKDEKMLDRARVNKTTI